MTDLDSIIEDVKNEYLMAVLMHGRFYNAHEGYAVLLEEVDELWDEVKKKQGTPNRLKNIREEAIQVAAMAIRIIHDCCEVNEKVS